jgi:hypothetical protein
MSTDRVKNKRTELSVIMNLVMSALILASRTQSAISQTVYSESSCLTIAGKDPNKHCVFGYARNGRNITGCTWEKGTDTHWCQTQGRNSLYLAIYIYIYIKL